MWSLVDIVVPAGGDPEHAPGGSPLNVAVGLARLGIDTTLLTQVGDDELGRLVRAHVLDSDVTLHQASVVADHPTSTATAHLDERGAASYVFDLHWTLQPQGLPAEATALHVGSIGAALRPGRDSILGLIEQARNADLLVTFDPNARPAFTPDADRAWQDVREVAAAATLVKMSDEDLHFLRAGATAEEVARQLLGDTTRMVVVTFGGHKAVAFSERGFAEVPAHAAAVVDTVGAGDSFMAALLAVVAEHGLADLGRPRMAAYLSAAHEAAAVTVSRRGADPPRREELPDGWPHVS
jgi:fructokinase